MPLGGASLYSFNAGAPLAATLGARLPVFHLPSAGVFCAHCGVHVRHVAVISPGNVAYKDARSLVVKFSCHGANEERSVDMTDYDPMRLDLYQMISDLVVFADA